MNLTSYLYTPAYTYIIHTDQEENMGRDVDRGQHWDEGLFSLTYLINMTCSDLSDLQVQCG